MIGLGQYYKVLVENGYENIDFITDITWEDLQEIGITKLGERRWQSLCPGLNHVGCEFGSEERRVCLFTRPTEMVASGGRWSRRYAHLGGMVGLPTLEEVQASWIWLHF